MSSVGRRNNWLERVEWLAPFPGLGRGIGGGSLEGALLSRVVRPWPRRDSMVLWSRLVWFWDVEREVCGRMSRT